MAKMQIKRMGVLSVAKIYSVVMAVAGLIVGVIYGLFFIIFGAIGALVYNVAAGFVGGVELELESVGDAYAAPPPPPQYGASQYQPGQQQQYPY